MLAALESTFALPSSTNEGAGSSSAASTQRQSGSGPSLEELAAKHAESAKNINMAELAASVASIENPGRKRGTAAKREAKAKAAAGGVGDFRGLGFAPPVPKKKAQPKKPGKRGKRGKHRRDAGSAYADKLSSKVRDVGQWICRGLTIRRRRRSPA